MTEQAFNESYVAVHCETEHDAKEFLALAATYKYEWYEGNSLNLRSHFDVYKQDTCYTVGTSGYVGYGRLEYFIKEGYKIVEYEDIANKVYFI